MSSVLAWSFGGISDNRVVLSGSSIARAHGLGTAWTKLRVAVRLQFDNTGSSFAGGALFVGLCSGITNIYGAKACTNAFGYLYEPTAAALNVWALTVGAYSTYSVGNSNSAQTVKNIAGVITKSAGINDGATTFFPADQLQAQRKMLFVDIIKGAPNYTINMFYPNSGANNGDVLVADFLAQAALATPAFAGHNFAQNGGALAFDQSAGVLDSVCLSWNQTSVKCYISDVAAKVIA